MYLQTKESSLRQRSSALCAQARGVGSLVNGPFSCVGQGKDFSEQTRPSCPKPDAGLRSAGLVISVVVAGISAQFQFDRTNRLCRFTPV